MDSLPTELSGKSSAWLMLLNCDVGEDSWESLGLQEIKPVNPKGNQSWIFIGRTDAEAETLILWPPNGKNWLLGKDPDVVKAGGEGDSRGWDGWMASLTRWTWVWARSRSWWWTGKPGMLQSLGWQRVGHDWVTEHMKIGLHCYRTATIRTTDVLFSFSVLGFSLKCCGKEYCEKGRRPGIRRPRSSSYSLIEWKANLWMVVSIAIKW